MEQVTHEEAARRHAPDELRVIEVISHALVTHFPTVQGDVARHARGSEYVPFYSTAAAVYGELRKAAVLSAGS